jgi:CheY-like chemotaxis protein
MLELQGHEVHEATDGEAAIRIAVATRPDIAIVDIGLPRLDGYSVAASLRAPEQGLTGIRLIALTGYGTDQDRQRAMDAGFDAHLTKPVDPEQLTRLIGGISDQGGAPTARQTC